MVGHIILFSLGFRSGDDWSVGGSYQAMLSNLFTKFCLFACSPITVLLSDNRIQAPAKRLNFCQRIVMYYYDYF